MSNERDTLGSAPVVSPGAGSSSESSVPPDISQAPGRHALWIVLAAMAGFLVLAAVFWIGGQVAVPDVTGVSQEEAAVALEAAGLSIGQTSSEPTLTVPPGTVVGQSPAPAETVREGTSVDLFVASIPEATVPDVVGMTSSEAEAELAVAGLRVGEVTGVYTPDDPAGTVLSQLPEADTEVTVATEVALEISAGPEQGAVPDVTGLASADAFDTLETAGFAAEETKKTSDDVEPGIVISQAPAAGTVAQTGATVAVTVSSGPPISVPAPPSTSDDDETEQPSEPAEPETPAERPDPEPEPELTAVPDLIGMRVLQAFMELRQAKLQFAIAWGPIDEGFLSVIAQDPGAGAEVEPGSIVTVTVGLPSFLFGDVEVQPLPSESSGGAEGSSTNTESTTP